MVTHTHHMEQFEDKCDKDELVFQAKFEDEFNKFFEKNFIEKQKIHLIRLSLKLIFSS